MLVLFGTDQAVDNVIYRLVHVTRELVRVSQGQYVKRSRTTPVTLIEVVTCRAKAFGREIIQSAREIAFQRGVIQTPGPPNVFHTNGRTSKFRFGDEEIFLKGVSPRKMALGDSFVGQTIRALWHLGKDAVNENLIGLATREFSINQRVEMGRLCSSMPGWLGKFFYGWNLLGDLKSDGIRPFRSTYPEEDSEERSVQEGIAVYAPAHRFAGDGKTFKPPDLLNICRLDLLKTKGACYLTKQYVDVIANVSTV
jgi:hypothetical protein